MLGRQLVELVGQLVGFPRHLSQHTGGMVMTRGPLCELVPIENAAMPDRTVIQWNKDDLDELGILKVDCLALGMLSAIHRAFDLVEKDKGTVKRVTVTRREGDRSMFLRESRQWRIGQNGPVAGQASPTNLRSVPAVPRTVPSPWPTSPQDDPDVYAMIRRADTMGVFQIESRAQMSMLPRLRPRCFYDLVIEVAIVRPGPIQGNMVHPYLRRRNGEEPVTYPSDEIRAGAGKDAGRAAVSGAGDAAGGRGGRIHARRGRPAPPRHGRLAPAGHHRPVPQEADRRDARPGAVAGVRRGGVPPDPRVRRLRVSRVARGQLRPVGLCVGVAEVPPSGGVHRGPANSQPMGFYAPAQLVRNARDHGVEVRPVDVNHSDWDCTLEETQNDECGMMNDECRNRTLFNSSFIIHHSSFLSPPRLPHDDRLLRGPWPADRRGPGAEPFRSLEDFARRTGLSRSAITRLAKAGAFGSLGLDRRGALWHALAQEQESLAAV